MTAPASQSRSYLLEPLQVCTAGSAFGAALTLARVYLPNVIMDQMRMKDFHMLEVFLTATSLSSIVFLSLERLGISQRVTRGNSKLAFLGANLSRYDGNILGGTLIGTGMALAGACPGTVIVQLAQGLHIARITTLGAILGGVAWVLTEDKVVASASSASAAQPTAGKSSSSISLEKDSRVSTKSRAKDEHNQVVKKPLNLASGQSRITISEALSTSPAITYAGFLVLLTGTIAASVSFFPGKTSTIIPTVLAGSLIATAQAISLTVAGTPLGTSAAYEQIGQYITRGMNIALGTKRRDIPAFPPKSILFATGMIIGSVVVSRYENILVPVLRGLPLFKDLPFGPGDGLSSLGSEVSVSIPSTQALVGGIALSYGARMAGGCTSGHGISGLSSMSWASLISVMSMFGGGIAVRLVLDTVLS